MTPVSDWSTTSAAVPAYACARFSAVVREGRPWPHSPGSPAARRAEPRALTRAAALRLAASSTRGSAVVPDQAPLRLILWDIDKTLVDIGHISREIYKVAFRTVTGSALRRMPPMTGRTDRDITLSTLRLHEISDPERYLPDFYAALTRECMARQQEIRLQGRAMAGAREAVERAATVPDLVQSVVTGNIRPTAEIKLGAFGLGASLDLDIGGYGSDDGERATLVRLARKRAENAFGVANSPQYVFVIGDTPHDIAGAKANGVRAIGVASGSSTIDELTAAGADVVLDSLADTDRLMRIILS